MHMFRSLRFAFLAVLALLVLPAGAQDLEDGNDYSAARLVAPVATVQPGATFDVGLHLTMAPKWHVYWINPGDSGTPPSLTWTLPEGINVGPMRWPFPERILVPPLASYAYEDEVLLPMTVTLPPGFSGDVVTLRARAEWLVCADVCLPAEADVSLTLPVRASAAADPGWQPRFAAAERLLPVTNAGWSFRAARTGPGYTLALIPPGGWNGRLDSLYFFADSTGVLQHPAPQALTQEGGTVRLALERSEFATEPVTRLRGVLVLPEGAAWNEEGRRALAVDVPVETDETAAPAGDMASAGGLSLLLAVVFAFGGGLLLNAMPCVFPVLSIKLLGFVRDREGDRAHLRRHGAAFAAGVLVSFWVLAGALLLLRASGEGLGWGFQLQRPGVVAALALLMFGLGLNMAGVFEVGTGLAGAAGRLDRHSGLGGAFFSGVLATIVATPCTAPFMGAALGYALAQPAFSALVVFTALGLGMALPYVLLASFPSWLQRLPRPGPWMTTLRQALSFPLFLTVVWLAWVLGQQTGIDGLAYFLLALVMVALGAWLVGRWHAAAVPRRTYVFTRALALVAAACALYAVVVGVRQSAAPAAGAVAGAWRSFDPAAVETLVAAGQPVFVDFTAAWCLSCQVNKRVALQTDAVEAAFRARGVETFRADWTRRDPVITAALERFGRSGVPLYVLYPGGDAAPVLLPAVLTPGLVLDALDALPARTTARLTTP
jgi:thiol:disulfide interchange protein/DsbC/DsbD-like thiol-disulfide interchange protein